MSEKEKTAIIIGAGPAGLTAAYEFLHKTDIIPIVFEATDEIGGISKTVNYKGNHIDIGGHRFFSKSDIVMDWWLNIMPLEQIQSEEPNVISYQNKSREVLSGNDAPVANDTDNIMLIRKRLSRIYFLRKFFSYPISLNWSTIKNLGFIRLIKIGFSYTWIRIFPIRNERTLEDFFINRFGKELYKTFFRDYTEKVWGVKCAQISAEWGAQRVKGLSVSKAFKYAIKRVFSSNTSISQKNIETSLIEQFLYPKYGPGQLWQRVAKIIEEKGGKVLLNHKVKNIEFSNEMISGVSVINENKEEKYKGDYIFSTMPVIDLINGFRTNVPEHITQIANGLTYRDFITVGLLLRKMKIAGKEKLVKDNWIYIQESDVKIGRLQIFNNWSPFMVKDPNTVWIGLEYFCNEGDDLWEMKDDKFKEFAKEELIKIDMIAKEDILDAVIIRVPKTYPAYFGTYNKFEEIIKYTGQFENLFLIGRNGMHKYNNQDHSMLTAINAVKNISEGITSKDNIWSVNTEQDYHEEK